MTNFPQVIGTGVGSAITKPSEVLLVARSTVIKEVGDAITWISEELVVVNKSIGGVVGTAEADIDKVGGCVGTGAP